MSVLEDRVRKRVLFALLSGKGGCFLLARPGAGAALETDHTAPTRADGTRLQDEPVTIWSASEYGDEKALERLIDIGPRGGIKIDSKGKASRPFHMPSFHGRVWGNSHRAPCSFSPG